MNFSPNQKQDWERVAKEDLSPNFCRSVTQNSDERDPASHRSARLSSRTSKGPLLAVALLLSVLLSWLGAPNAAFGVVGGTTYHVALAWNPSTDPNVIGYRVYYGGSSGVYTNVTDIGNATSNTVTGLIGGSAYYFSVTAYDSTGMESAFSGEVSYTPAIPSLQLTIAPGRQFNLGVFGQIGHTYNILASQDLKTWTVIGTAALGAGGSLLFTDPNASQYESRFYRLQDTAP